MTYLQAVSMKQELTVALQYRELEPNEYKNVAKKYSAVQWMECRKALLEELNKEEDRITEMVKFVMLVRKGAAL
jgi:hypothetical protein